MARSLMKQLNAATSTGPPRPLKSIGSPAKNKPTGLGALTATHHGTRMVAWAIFNSIAMREAMSMSTAGGSGIY